MTCIGRMSRNPAPYTVCMYSEENQRIILGDVLAGGQWDLDTFDPDDFSPRHRLILEKMQLLARRGDETDRITVANELMRSNELKSVGGLSYLIELSDTE